jgi:predicted RNA-binding Zn-ribbon protein involved in translation (DUF1610 family)
VRYTEMTDYLCSHCGIARALPAQILSLSYGCPLLSCEGSKSTPEDRRPRCRTCGSLLCFVSTPMCPKCGEKIPLQAEC